MNRLIARVLVSTILVGTVVGVAKGDVPEEWKSLDVAGLTKLAQQLRTKGDAGKAARQRLAAHVANTYLANAEATRSVSAHQWYSLAQCLAGDLSAEDRQLWSGKLRGAFAESNLNLHEVINLVDGMRWLGDRMQGLSDEKASGFLASWVARSVAWKSCKPGELVSVAQRLYGDDEAVKAARKRLADHVVADYLADNTRIRSIGYSDWKALSQSLCSALSAEERLAWAGKLCSAFIDPQVLGELKARDMNELTRALSCLDRGQAARLVSEWFKNYKDWAKSPIGDLILTGTLTASNDQADRKQIVTRLAEVWLARSGELSCWQCFFAGGAWLSVPDVSKARQWMMRGYESAVGTEQARAAADATTLISLGYYLRLRGIDLTGEGKGYPEFAAVLARLAGQGKIPVDERQRYQYYAAPLGTSQTRLTVRAELTDAEGNPRPIVAKILAIAYRNAGELKAWQTSLDEKIAATNGDAKARWLIARAFAESIIPSEPSPLRGRKWLEEAIKTAGSSSCRFAALQELALAYADVGRSDKALAVIDSAAGRFAGAKAAADLEALRQEVRQTKATVEADWARMRKLVEYFEAEAQKAAEKGDENRKKYFLDQAGLWRQKEKELLERDGL